MTFFVGSWFKGTMIEYFLQIMIMEAIVFSSCEKRKGFWLRLLIPAAVITAWSYCEPAFGFSGIGALNWITDFLFALGIAAFSYKISFFNLCFYGISPWAIQHIASCISFIITYILSLYSVSLGGDTVYSSDSGLSLFRRRCHLLLLDHPQLRYPE